MELDRTRSLQQRLSETSTECHRSRVFVRRASTTLTIVSALRFAPAFRSYGVAGSEASTGITVAALASVELSVSESFGALEFRLA